MSDLARLSIICISHNHALEIVVKD